MSDRGIIFSAPMVLALLDGRKTQTRRLLKVPGICGGRYPILPPEQAIELEPGEFSRGVWHYRSTAALSGPFRLPAAVGDRLWVRESFALGYDYDEDDKPVNYEEGPRPFYAATECPRWYDTEKDGWRDQPRWTPSIHMPRRASRLTLLVDEVRVEPLQSISAADCYDEGIQRPTGPVLGSDVCARDNARTAYRQLWESLHGAGSWAENPLVVALTFRVVRANIDSLAEREAA